MRIVVEDARDYEKLGEAGRHVRAMSHPRSRLSTWQVRCKQRSQPSVPARESRTLYQASWRPCLTDMKCEALSEQVQSHRACLGMRKSGWLGPC
jgi:hypothetical protein